MMNNKIEISGNGNITLQSINGSTITINKTDGVNTIIQKLSELQETQLDALQQIVAQQTEQFEDLFKQMLKTIAQHKGVEANKYATIQEHHGGGDNIAGDKKVYQVTVHYHHYPTNKKLPRQLTTEIPSIAAKDIIGRDTDLKEVRKLLLEDKRVVVVNGLGGIGKTTLAQAYVGAYGDKYEHLIWLSQTDGDNFPLDVINADGLTQNLNIETKGKEPLDIFREVLAALQSIEDKPNLWIIDNANAHLYQYYNSLPKQPNWHILATSREVIEHFYKKSLDFLSEAEGIRLFQKHCKLIKDEEAIKAILKTIDYHTLTIEILAKTAQKQRTSIENLQKAIEKDLKAQVHIPHNAAKIDRVFSYLLSIFDCSALTDIEIWLMKQLTALPSEYYLYDNLKLLIDPEAAGKADDFAATLHELVEKGWLLYNTEADSYKMHRIIQEVILKKLPLTLEDIAPLVEQITTRLHIDQTKDNPIDKFQWIPYGQAILAIFSNSTDANVSRLSGGKLWSEASDDGSALFEFGDRASRPRRL